MAKKKKDGNNIINIKYKKAYFNYEFIEKYIAGIELKGTEIKSIKEGKVNFNDAYCIFKNGELYVKGMHIAEYKLGNIFNHDPSRLKKLLLHKNELIKLKQKMEEKGLTIVPVRLFINDKGLAKLEIVLAKGKKLHDKRESIKEREYNRNLNKKIWHNL